MGGAFSLRLPVAIAAASRRRGLSQRFKALHNGIRAYPVERPEGSSRQAPRDRLCFCSGLACASRADSRNKSMCCCPSNCGWSSSGVGARRSC